jgi:hypothetical protein
VSLSVAEAAAIGICVTARLFPGRSHTRCRFCATSREKLIAQLAEYGVAYVAEQGYVMDTANVRADEAEFRRLSHAERQARVRAAQEPPESDWLTEALTA